MKLTLSALLAAAAFAAATPASALTLPPLKGDSVVQQATFLRNHADKKHAKKELKKKKEAKKKAHKQKAKHKAKAKKVAEAKGHRVAEVKKPKGKN
ncbi:MAG: hypothetical protein IKE66_07365 [Hyphomicrobium sp.]|nr:hypothetical protein [Hyphomicrobium sp.]